MVLRRIDVGGPEREQLLGAREGLFRGAETLAYDPAEVMLDHVLLGLDYGRETGLPLCLRIRGLHEQDRRTWSHHMAVLHVELGLACPACVIAGRDRSVRLDDREPWGSG